MKKYFITIKIIDECWKYKIDQQFTSIVYARSEYFAEKKFQGEHNGSEYPSFIIVSITQEDSYLFNGTII